MAGESWQIVRVRPDQIEIGDRSPGGHYEVTGKPFQTEAGGARLWFVPVVWKDGGDGVREWSSDDTVTVDREVKP